MALDTELARIEAVENGGKPWPAPAGCLPHGRPAVTATATETE